MKTRVPFFLRVAIFAFIAGLPGLSHGAIYMKVDAISGEVREAAHPDWIDVDSVSYGAARSVTTEGGPSTPSVSELAISRRLDAASAYLFYEAVTGKASLNPVELHFTKIVDDKAQTYSKLFLTEAIFSAYSQHSSGERPDESLAINFSKFRFEYTDYSKPNPTTSFVWYDLIKNTADKGEVDVIMLPPTISTISNLSTAEDTPVTANFTIADPDTSVDVLKVIKSSSNTALMPLNRISFGGSGANRSVQFDPASNQSGTADIIISVSDGSKSDSTSFVLTVSAVNDPPGLSGPTRLHSLYETEIALAGLSASDADAGTQTLLLTLAAGQGNVTVDDTVSGISVIQNGTANVQVQGALPALNTLFSSSAGIRYRSHNGFFGEDTLALQLNDQGATGAGGALSYSLNIPLWVHADAVSLWKYENFGEALFDLEQEAALWGDSVDADFDRIPNLVEYALGLNPNVPDDRDGLETLQLPGTNGTHFGLSFRHRQSLDLTIVVQSTAQLDLNDWASGAAVLQPALTEDLGDGFLRVTYRDVEPTTTASNRFYRIGVRRTP